MRGSCYDVWNMLVDDQDLLKSKCRFFQRAFQMFPNLKQSQMWLFLSIINSREQKIKYTTQTLIWQYASCVCVFFSLLALSSRCHMCFVSSQIYICRKKSSAKLLLNTKGIWPFQLSNQVNKIKFDTQVVWCIRQFYCSLLQVLVCVYCAQFSDDNNWTAHTHTLFGSSQTRENREIKKNEINKQTNKEHSKKFKFHFMPKTGE